MSSPDVRADALRDADDGRGRRHRRRAMLSTLLALGFDASKFRFCSESSFCEETRPGSAKPPAQFSLLPGSLELTAYGARGGRVA